MNAKEIGVIDVAAISYEICSNQKNRKPYFRRTDKDWYSIGKYASEHGNTAAVRKFKSKFSHLNERTVLSFKKKVKDEIKKASKERRESKQQICKYSSTAGRPLLLGDLDRMVQSCLRALSNRGGAINTAIANPTADALIKWNTGVVGDIDVNLSRWATSLFRQMGFVKRHKTSSKVDIPDGARKDIKFLFHHDIASHVEEFNILETLIIDINKTQMKYAPVSKETVTKRNSASVTIEGSDDKRMITGTFAVT